MNGRIEHSGEVVRVAEGCVWVRITARSACASCRAREACGMGEAQEKIVAVRTPRAAAYAPGDAVTVGVAERMGVTAVVLAYVVPFLLLLGALAAASALDIAEGVAALAALGAVAVWYLVLWLLRRKIDKKIHFTITER